MTPLTTRARELAARERKTRARELAARERKLYDQRTIPAVLEELADEVERLTGELDESKTGTNYWRGEIDVILADRADEIDRVFAAEAEADKLRADAANSAAQRDEAVLRATRAEERLRAVEAEVIRLINVADHATKGWEHWLFRGTAAEAELSRIRNTTTKGQAI